jgi:Cu(I)/Ag(I) efflux system membrane fusion protein
MTTRYGLLMGLVLGLVALPACKKETGNSAAAMMHTLYHCAMHPQIIRDKPGDCPICQMRLVPIESTERGTPGPAQAAMPLYYRNPMDPRITSKVPMKDSMGMDYVPVYPEASESSMTPLPVGQGRVSISENREQLIGVKLATVQRRALDQKIHAAARVAYDPALYSAILEHQQVVRSAKERPATGSAEYRDEAASTVQASTLRLRQMGLSRQQIEAYGNASEPPANLLLGQSGGTLWVYAELYDYEAGMVHAGQTVTLTSPAFPGQSFQGRVKAVDTIMNSETRTLRARVEVPNADNTLKPEMYLTAEIHVVVGEGLTVPTAAILDTGERQIVYVAKGQGHYEPRMVKVGRSADGVALILSGLSEGDVVVASANFFIDSESKFQAAAQGQQP